MMRSMCHWASWQLGHYNIPGCLHYASFPRTVSDWLCLFIHTLIMIHQPISTLCLWYLMFQSMVCHFCLAKFHYTLLFCVSLCKKCLKAWYGYLMISCIFFDVYFLVCITLMVKNPKSRKEAVICGTDFYHCKNGGLSEIAII